MHLNFYKAGMILLCLGTACCSENYKSGYDNNRYAYVANDHCTMNVLQSKSGVLSQNGLLEGWIIRDPHSKDIYKLHFDEAAIAELDKICPKSTYEMISDTGMYSHCRRRVRAEIKFIKRIGTDITTCVASGRYAVISLKGE